MKNTGYDETSLLSGQRKDRKGQTTGINIAIRVIFVRSRSFLRSVLSFVSSQVCGPSSLFFISPRTQLTCDHLLLSLK